MHELLTWGEEEPQANMCLEGFVSRIWVAEVNIHLIMVCREE